MNAVAQVLPQRAEPGMAHAVGNELAHLYRLRLQLQGRQSLRRNHVAQVHEDGAVPGHGQHVAGQHAQVHGMGGQLQRWQFFGSNAVAQGGDQRPPPPPVQARWRQEIGFVFGDAFLERARAIQRVLSTGFLRRDFRSRRLTSGFDAPTPEACQLGGRGQSIAFASAIVAVYWLLWRAVSRFPLAMVEPAGYTVRPCSFNGLQPARAAISRIRSSLAWSLRLLPSICSISPIHRRTAACTPLASSPAIRSMNSLSALSVGDVIV